MKTVAGVFGSQDAAREAAEGLRRAGFSQDQVYAFFPGDKESMRSVPTSYAEQPGLGGAIGGVIGGAVGVIGGLELGLATTALIPGVGPVIAIGLAGAALLGVGGAAGGAALGKAAEDKSTDGVPADELYFYEDALRQSRSVVLLLAADSSEEERARKILGDAGAESLDAARQAWWLGLRGVEKEQYQALGRNFEDDELIYRSGFEAALRRECRGKTFTESIDRLKWSYPDVWESEPFRRGYERGLEYWTGRAAVRGGTGNSQW